MSEFTRIREKSTKTFQKLIATLSFQGKYYVNYLNNKKNSQCSFRTGLHFQKVIFPFHVNEYAFIFEGHVIETSLKLQSEP